MKNLVGLFFTGVGIGIFLGLSNSPILMQILVPLLTVIAGLLSILSGQKTNEGSTETLLNKNISPFPIMWLIIGMVAGAFIGLLAKNHDITGVTSPKSVSPTSISQNALKEEKEQQKTSTVLHGLGVSEDFCEKYHLCNLSGVELLCALRDIENPEIEEMLSKKQINLDSVKIKINLSCKCQK